MAKPQTRDELDEAAARGCGNPACGRQDHELFLHGRCHPGSPVQVKYVGRSGVLNIYCGTCMKPVGDIAVAWDAAPAEPLH